MSKDPLMTYIKSHLLSKHSQGDTAVIVGGGSTSPSVDLGSFGSQGSMRFEELEFLRPCGEGSFGKVCSNRQQHFFFIEVRAIGPYLPSVALLQVYVASWHQTHVAVKVLQARTEGAQGRQSAADQSSGIHHHVFYTRFVK